MVNHDLLDTLLQEVQPDLKAAIGSEEGEKEYKDFLVGLEKILIGGAGKDIPTILLDHFIAYGVAAHYRPDDLKQLRLDYIQALAEDHEEGKVTTGSVHLEESSDPEFSSHLAFIKNLRSGIKVQARKDLREFLISLTKVTQVQVSKEELFRAFKILEEREALREKLLGLEIGVFAQGKGQQTQSNLRPEPGPVSATKKKTKQFFLRPRLLAVAASVAGIAIIATFIWREVDYQSDDLDKNQLYSKENSSPGNLPRSTQSGTTFPSSDSVMMVPLLKDTDDKTPWEAFTDIMVILRKGDSGDDMVPAESYRFNAGRNTLEIRMKIQQPIKNIIRIRSHSGQDLIYLHLGTQFYRCEENPDYLPLTAERDRNRINELRKIEDQEKF